MAKHPKHHHQRCVYMHCVWVGRGAVAKEQRRNQVFRVYATARLCRPWSCGAGGNLSPMPKNVGALANL